MNYPTLKSSPTGNRGGQFGNDNASKDHVDLDWRGVEEQHVDAVFKPMRDVWLAEINPDDDRLSSEFHAVERYSHNAYHDINIFLRKGPAEYKRLLKSDDPDLHIGRDDPEPLIESMDKAFRPSTRDMYLYRGITRKWADLKMPEQFSDKGYTSTSLHPHFASSWADMVRIHVPEGTPIAFGYYDGGKEWEVILPRNSKFKQNGTHKMYWDRDVPNLELVKNDS